MKMKITFFSLCAAALMFTSCEPNYDYIYYTKDQASKMQDLNIQTLLPYEVELPVHLSRMGLFARPVDSEKATLGRVIFYDKSLSSDGKISCASCHHQDHGFADPNATSTGVEDRQSTRNSIALGSVVNFSAYYGTDINGPTAIRFFWDNRAETVEQQSRGAFTNHDEMNMTMSEVVNTIRAKSYYTPLFQKAYNPDLDDASIPQITEARVFEAVAEFINSMGSYHSKFDTEADKLYLSNNNAYGVDLIKDQSFSGFTADENAGKNLYMANCASCHSTNMGRPILNFANNGLDQVYTDKGVGGITNTSSELYQFKVPTLRNVEVSAPYMHDGRFTSLEDVLEHYSAGIKANSGLSAPLKNFNGTPKNMNFSTTEKQQLIAFLKTLTDDVIKNEARFSDPFK